jgi:hypothetical protein
VSKVWWFVPALLVVWLIYSQRDTPSSPTTHRANVGAETTAAGKAPWICGSTKDALDSALKWAVRNDKPEMLREIAKTR